MNQQDQQAIDGLFQYLSRSAAQAGPRDPQAEASIQEHIQQGPPGLLYQMAQTLVGQQAALRQLRAQLADCQQRLSQSGSPAGFAQPGWRGAGQQGYGGYGPSAQQPYGAYGPPAQQPSGWQRSGGQGFLAGAGQIALGVGGGILAADALSSLFSGGGLFGDDDRAYDQGFDQGQDQGFDQGQDQADQGQADQGQAYDDGGYGAGDVNDGGFDDGGFDDGGGW